jgi:hypothetical protein
MAKTFTSRTKATQKAAKAALSKSKLQQSIKTEKPIKSKSLVWGWHTLVDASLENRPLLRAPIAGERSLDFTAQGHYTALPQGGGVQVTMRLRAQISVQDGILTLAEMHYAGVAELPNTVAPTDMLLAELYPHARASLLQVLSLAGHEPPLPATYEALNQAKTDK